MGALSENKLATLRKVASDVVYLDNKDRASVTGIRQPTVSSLRADGLLDVNGADRRVIKGLSYRRAVVTSAGQKALPNG